MGCDIHTFVERRVSGKWICVTKKVTDEDGDTSWDDPYTERRYTTFAVLAGVRDREGFAPIDAARGMPADLSDEGKARVAEDDYCHSHSWLTLRELAEFDWTKLQATEAGCTRAELEARVASGRVARDKCYVRPDSQNVFYPDFVSYAEACEYFLNSVVPYMASLGGLDDVRLLFYFDN